jgi:hypothetical protein
LIADIERRGKMNVTQMQALINKKFALDANSHFSNRQLKELGITLSD